MQKVFAAKIVTIPLKFTIAILFIYSLLLKGCYYIFNASY